MTIRQFAQWFQLHLVVRSRRFGPALAVAVLAGGVGFYSLQASHAATLVANIEAEDGILTGSQSAGDPSGASGSASVKFGGAVTPPAGSSGLDFPANPVVQQASVSQWGITWQFDKAYPTGQFANGDWWVVGPVTVTGISPASNTSTKQNGENINPKKGDIGYDGGLNGPFMSLTFPKTVAANSSIVKGVVRPANYGDQRHRGKLKTAAVLTVLAQAPLKNGSVVFRPPYFEAEKPLYYTTDLKTNLLPTMTLPAGTWDSLATVANLFQRVQLDHDTGDEGNRISHPVDNLKDYGAEYSMDTNFAALRLMMNDPLSAKSQALINYVQYGIDLSAMYKYDSHVGSDGGRAGHGPGRTLPLVFAATMLDSPTIKTILNNAQNQLTENLGVYRSPNATVVLFGDGDCSKSEYDTVRAGGSGSRTCKDPYGGYIDGGQEPGGSYQYCCTSKPWKGSVAAVWLMPSMKPNWPHFDDLAEYVDRWVDFGAWTKPDPQSRYLSKHGTVKDEGYYETPLAENLWARENLTSRVTKNYVGL